MGRLIMGKLTKVAHGLMAAYRKYRCDVCGAINSTNTNHTSKCFSHCPSCSWRSGYDSDGCHYRADIGKLRPHYYVGDNPTGVGSQNPHSTYMVSELDFSNHFDKWGEVT